MDMPDKIDIMVIIGAITSLVTIEGTVMFVAGVLSGVFAHNVYLKLWKRSAHL